MPVEGRARGLPGHDGRIYARRMHRESFTVATEGRSTNLVSAEVDAIVERSKVREGLATIFIHHTSASLILCENADPSVRRDLEAFAQRLCPDGDPDYTHRDEGPDDMSAHLRSVLTQASISIPVAEGRCDLGTWQGLYLWEHRNHAHRRRVTVVVQG